MESERFGIIRKSKIDFEYVQYQYGMQKQFYLAPSPAPILTHGLCQTKKALAQTLQFSKKYLIYLDKISINRDASCYGKFVETAFE